VNYHRHFEINSQDHHGILHPSLPDAGSRYPLPSVLGTVFSLLLRGWVIRIRSLRTSARKYSYSELYQRSFCNAMLGKNVLRTPDLPQAKPPPSTACCHPVPGGVGKLVRYEPSWTKQTGARPGTSFQLESIESACPNINRKNLDPSFPPSQGRASFTSPIVLLERAADLKRSDKCFSGD
jgi:hypothetical protein